MKLERYFNEKVKVTAWFSSIVVAVSFSSTDDPCFNLTLPLPISPEAENLIPSFEHSMMTKIMQIVGNAAFR